jgi:hypothetical protein
VESTFSRPSSRNMASSPLGGYGERKANGVFRAYRDCKQAWVCGILSRIRKLWGFSDMLTLHRLRRGGKRRVHGGEELGNEELGITDRLTQRNGR